MKKFIKGALTAGVVLSISATGGAIVACGGGDDNDPGSSVRQYEITVTDPETGGDIAADLSKAEPGTTVTVTITPDSGYELSYLTVGGQTVEVGEDNTYTFEMPAGNVTIGGEFVPTAGAINIAKPTHGKLAANKKTASAGDTVELTVTPDFGYVVDEVKVGTTVITPVNGNYSFTMPDGTAAVTAKFKVTDELLVEELPEEYAAKFGGKSSGGGDRAESVWKLSLGADALTVEVWVEDATVFTDFDSVSMCFGRKGFAYTELGETNKQIKIGANGEATYYTVAEGEKKYSEAETPFATSATVKVWGKTAGAVAGYKATVVVPYTAFGEGVTQETVIDTVTMLPVVRTNNSNNETYGTDVRQDPDCDKNVPTTYPVISADNMLTPNKYLHGTGQLGSGKSVTSTGRWDLSKDYCEEDTENYASREVTLKGNVGDNDLIFFNSESDHIYAKATIKVNEIFDTGEHWGKFGMMLFDGRSKNGVFYYVDAFVGNDNEGKVENIIGKAVGFNKTANFDGGYKTLADDVFDLETKTIILEICYDNGLVSFYADGAFVGMTDYKASGPLQVGFKSFKYGITVSDYTVITDEEDATFKDKARKPEATESYGVNEDSALYEGKWIFDKKNDSVANTSGGDSYIYNTKFGLETDFYFETDIKVPDRFNNDEYPKAGIVLRNDSRTLFAYMDIVSQGGYTGNFSAVGLTSGGASGGGWDWSKGHGGGDVQIAALNVKNDFVRMGVAKIGDTLYILINGKVVKTETGVYGMTADTEYYVGVLGFNMKMELKNAASSNVKAEVERYIIPTYTLSNIIVDGLTLEYDGNITAAKRGDTVSFTITAQDMVIESVTVSFGGGAAQTLTKGDDGKYSFVMGDGNAYIGYRVEGRILVSVGEYSEYIRASKGIVEAGTEITFSALDTDKAIKALTLTVMGSSEPVVLTPVNGVCTYTVNAETTVTSATVLFYKDGIYLDGTLDEKFGEVTTKAVLNGDREMNVWAVKGESGVWLYSTCVSNTNVVTGGDIWSNANFEIWLNNGDHNAVGKNHLHRVTAKYFDTVQIKTEGAQKGKYLHTAKVYIDKDFIKDWSDSADVQLNYAWKHPGEAVIPVNGVVHQFDYFSSDWWHQHAIGGGRTDRVTELGGGAGFSKNLFITKTGLFIPGQDATGIDGVLTEYAELESVTVGDANKATLKVTGTVKDDGLYLGLTITHGQWSAFTTNDWAKNDNIEMRINGESAAIVFDNLGNMSATALFKQAKAVTKTVDGKLVTDVELYMPGTYDKYYLKFGMAGAGFGGWQALVWDNNSLELSSAGAKRLNLDTGFTDAVFTDEIKGKVITATTHGATVKVSGAIANEGIYLKFVIDHVKEVSDHFNGNGDAWFHFMNVEWRLSGKGGQQLYASVRNGFEGRADRVFGKTTTVNKDGGGYTTTLEVFVPNRPDTYVPDEQGRVKIAFATIIDGGFERPFGDDYDANNYKYYVTANGIEAIA